MANYSFEGGFFLPRLDSTRLLTIERSVELRLVLSVCVRIPGGLDPDLGMQAPSMSVIWEGLSSPIWACRFCSEGRPSLSSLIIRHEGIVPILVIAISVWGADVCCRLRPKGWRRRLWSLDVVNVCLQRRTYGPVFSGCGTCGSTALKWRRSGALLKALVGYHAGYVRRTHPWRCRTGPYHLGSAIPLLHSDRCRRIIPLRESRSATQR